MASKNYFISTTPHLDLFMISHEIRLTLREGQVDTGYVLVSLPTGGAGLLVIEKGADSDIKKLISQETTKVLLRILLPKATVLPVEKGKLLMDPWQEVYLVDYDNSGRRREFWVQTFSSGGAALPAAGAGGNPPMMM